MTIDTVNDLPPRVQYVATVAQTAFDYTFPIFADADLVVDVDGVTQALTTDYTVAGEGDDAGGTVTFLVAMAGSEVVTIYRSMAIERTTDFSQNGEFSSDTFNDELDRITLVLQDLRAQIRRSLRLPMTAEAADTEAELSPIANWLDKYVYVNASGVPEPATAVTAGTTLSQSTVGLALWPLSSAESGVGLTAADVREHYTYGNVKRYGAAGDGATPDDVAFANALLVAAVTDGEVYVPASSAYYELNSALAVPSGITIRGDGYGSIIKQATADTATFTLTSVSNVRITGLHFRGVVDATTTGRVSLSAATNVTIEGNHFTNHSGWGVHSTGASANVTIKGNRFHTWVSPVNGSSGINVYNEGSQFTIVDNLIDGGSSSTSTGADFGISVLRSSGVGTFQRFVISNNQIKHIREYGLLVYANTETTTDIAITGNTIDYVYSSDDNTSGGAGIYLVRPGNMTITGNTIGHTNISTAASTLAPGAIGVNAAYGNLLINGNAIHDTTMYGIYVVAGAATSSIAINGNGVYAPGYSGIYVFQQNDTTINGNTITTTAATANIGAITALGLVGTHLENLTITNNEILAAGDQQIQVVYADDVIFSNNNVEMTDTSGSAVVLSVIDRAVVNGNLIKSDATSGVALYLSGVTAGRVSGNYLLCNHANAVYETTGTCTGTFADESNGLALATNAGTGSQVVLRATGAPAGTYQTGDRYWDTDVAAGASPGGVYNTAWKAMASIAA